MISLLIGSLLAETLTCGSNMGQDICNFPYIDNAYTISISVFSYFVKQSDDNSLIYIIGTYVSLNSTRFTDNTLADGIILNTQIANVNRTCFSNNTVTGKKTILYGFRKLFSNYSVVNTNDCTGTGESAMIGFSTCSGPVFSNVNITHNKMSQGIGYNDSPAQFIWNFGYATYANNILQSYQTSRWNTNNGKANSLFSFLAGLGEHDMYSSSFVDNEIADSRSAILISYTGTLRFWRCYFKAIGSSTTIVKSDSAQVLLFDGTCAWESNVSFGGTPDNQVNANALVFTHAIPECGHCGPLDDVETPTNEESTNEESTNEESTNEESTNEESTNEVSTNEESTNEESTNEVSTSEVSTSEEPTLEESAESEIDLSPARSYPPQGCAETKRVKLALKQIKPSLLPLVWSNSPFKI